MLCVAGFVAILSVALATAFPHVNPPSLARQFQTNYTVIVPGLGGAANTSFVGFLAVDDINFGLFWSLTGEEIVPLRLSTNIILHPTASEVEGYWFFNPICWVMPISKPIFNLFPLRIPRNATYQGTAVVHGVPCTLWQWIGPREYTFQMWVNQQTTSSGNAIVQVSVLNTEYVGSIYWYFHQTEVGPFDSSIYNPPNLKCIAPPIGAQAPANLLRIVAPFLF